MFALFDLHQHGMHGLNKSLLNPFFKNLAGTKNLTSKKSYLILPHMFRRLSERGVNCELTLVTWNKSQMGLHVKGVSFNDPVTLLHGEV